MRWVNRKGSADSSKSEAQSPEKGEICKFSEKGIFYRIHIVVVLQQGCSLHFNSRIAAKVMDHSFALLAYFAVKSLLIV